MISQRISASSSRRTCEVAGDRIPLAPNQAHVHRVFALSALQKGSGGTAVRSVRCLARRAFVPRQVLPGGDAVIVTEEDAKAKRCHESFGDGWTTPDGRMATVGAASQGTALVASPYYCISSGCMAWRWSRQATLDEWEKVVPHPDDMKRYVLAGYEEDPNHRGAMRKKISNAMPAFGYCGKAGKP